MCTHLKHDDWLFIVVYLLLTIRNKVILSVLSFLFSDWNEVYVFHSFNDCSELIHFEGLWVFNKPITLDLNNEKYSCWSTNEKIINSLSEWFKDVRYFLKRKQIHKKYIYNIYIKCMNETFKLIWWSQLFFLFNLVKISLFDFLLK